MEESTHIDSLEFDVEEVDFVKAGEDFGAQTSPYDSTIYATIHLKVNGEEVEHTNKLPARFDLADTARAHYEMIQELKEDEEYSDVPFCCTCSDRGCSYVEWEITEKGDKYELVMEDLIDQEIGDHVYSVSLDVLKQAVIDLLDTVIEFMESEGIERLGWAERKETPVAGRENWASLQEFKKFRQELS